MRRLTTLLLAGVLALGLAGAKPGLAHADSGGDNSAIAINTKDGSSLFKVAFAVRKVAGDVVDQQNGAVAYASCTDCQTVAIAIEIVLVEGAPSTVTPVNVALAINENCTLCTTFAAAYQFVVGTGGPVEFTPEGLKELAQIKNELERLKIAYEKGDLSLEELKAQVDELIGRIKVVLENDLVPAAGGGEENKGPPAAASTEPTATATEETATVPTTTTSTVTTQPTTTETVPTATSTETTPTTTSTTP